jgi:hypothetical protein
LFVLRLLRFGAAVLACPKPCASGQQPAHVLFNQTPANLLYKHNHNSEERQPPSPGSFQHAALDHQMKVPSARQLRGVAFAIQKRKTTLTTKCQGTYNRFILLSPQMPVLLQPEFEVCMSA